MRSITIFAGGVSLNVYGDWAGNADKQWGGLILIVLALICMVAGWFVEHGDA